MFVYCFTVFLTFCSVDTIFGDGTSRAGTYHFITAFYILSFLETAVCENLLIHCFKLFVLKHIEICCIDSVSYYSAYTAKSAVWSTEAPCRSDFPNTCCESSKLV